MRKRVFVRTFLKFDHRPDPAERDARVARDTRTEAQRWLNDPPPGRSALARKPTAD
jgi:hypothetical protein